MDSIRLQNQPLDVVAAIAAVTCPEAGGINLFLGTTRAESGGGGGGDTNSGGAPQLLALDYEAYEPMALAEMHKLLAHARSTWPITRAIIWHRLGRVAIGESSILIALSCPHRAESFEACRYLIDELKKSVPIWKKEIFTDAARWQMEK